MIQHRNKDQKVLPSVVQSCQICSGLFYENFMALKSDGFELVLAFILDHTGSCTYSTTTIFYFYWILFELKSNLDKFDLL
jgi:hypothetical protein